MASKMYGQFIAKAFNKEVDWDSDTIKVMLVGSGYTPNQDAHDYKNDVTGEVSGTGYTAGGATLTGKTITYDPASNVTVLDAADVSWANSTITARYAVVYDDAGATDDAKVLIGYIDFGSDQSSTAGNFTITWGRDWYRKGFYSLMDVRIEATAFTAGLDIVQTRVKAAVNLVVAFMAPVYTGVVASFPRTLSFGNTSLSAVAPDLYKNGGLYALV